MQHTTSTPFSRSALPPYPLAAAHARTRALATLTLGSPTTKTPPKPSALRQASDSDLTRTPALAAAEPGSAAAAAAAVASSAHTSITPPARSFNSIASCAATDSCRAADPGAEVSPAGISTAKLVDRAKAAVDDLDENPMACSRPVPGTWHEEMSGAHACGQFVSVQALVCS
eukprot:366399-Chlamydomonas_euryale.AAC.21